MITLTSLKEYTYKDLAQMARREGIPGWHTMRKAELVSALVRRARKGRSGAGGRGNGARKPDQDPADRNGQASPAASQPKHGATTKRSRPIKARETAVARRIREQHRRQEELKDLSRTGHGPPDKKGNLPARDRVVLMVRDPFWLQAYWELSGTSVERAKAAMAEYWHTARPVLRLMETGAPSSSSRPEKHLRDIEIHGGVNHWYIHVEDAPKGYRVEIGYAATNGRFHALARSNSVITPRPGSSDVMDEGWTDVAQNCERIYALSGGYSPENASVELQELLEERLRRPIGSPVLSHYGVGADAGSEVHDQFPLDVDVEMIIYGTTRPDAHVTLAAEPVRLRADGSFAIRMSLPDRRQVLPLVSSSSDGTQQQTIVLAIERNTKVMEPILRDAND